MLLQNLFYSIHDLVVELYGTIVPVVSRMLLHLREQIEQIPQTLDRRGKYV
jgi:hypothetical protein